MQVALAEAEHLASEEAGRAGGACCSRESEDDEGKILNRNTNTVLFTPG